MKKKKTKDKEEMENDRRSGVAARKVEATARYGYLFFFFFLVEKMILLKEFGMILRD